ncbi:MAG: DUF4105 domain-containing protein [Haliscomenobacter sp.]|nr:DUF4105 domain-containing protein [Haliscomenobacter sp.]
MNSQNILFKVAIGMRIARGGLWQSAAQYPTDSLRISLLTCAPGEALYSKFGHSAIRVADPANQTDIVYNYGLFDFDTPNFYVKFIRGKLPYQLGVQSFRQFMWDYEYERREVLETPLHLSPEHQAELLRFLEINYLPENRQYPYDFFFDNCASRIRDVLEKTAAMTYPPKDTMESSKTFRELLDEYIGMYPWINFGIDLILGLPTDQKAGFRGEMFLPDYLAKNLKAGQSIQKPVAAADTLLLSGQTGEPDHKPALTPFLAFALLFAAFALLSGLAPNSKALLLADALFFLALGLAGSLFTFMWAGTDHDATHCNMNLLWANPLAFGAFAALFYPSRRIWPALGALGAAIALMGFPFLPQALHPAVIPIALTVLLRCLYRLGVIPFKPKQALVEAVPG